MGVIVTEIPGVPWLFRRATIVWHRTDIFTALYAILSLPAFMNVPKLSLLSFGRGSKAAIRVPNLNLYPDDPFYDSLMGRGLQWAVSAGRHIVIFTELVVIGSFFSRFVLDRQLADLNRSIIQKQAIAESYGDLEANIRALQTKTSEVEEILAEQGKYGLLSVLRGVTPNDVIYSQVSISERQFSLQGSALSNRGLSLLVDGLKRHPQVQRVSINQIESGDPRDPTIRFGISAEYVFVAPSVAPAPRPAPANPEEAL